MRSTWLRGVYTSTRLHYKKENDDDITIRNNHNNITVLRTHKPYSIHSISIINLLIKFSYVISYKYDIKHVIGTETELWLHKDNYMIAISLWRFLKKRSGALKEYAVWHLLRVYSFSVSEYESAPTQWLTV